MQRRTNTSQTKEQEEPPEKHSLERQQTNAWIPSSKPWRKLLTAPHRLRGLRETFEDRSEKVSDTEEDQSGVMHTLTGEEQPAGAQHRGGMGREVFQLRAVQLFTEAAPIHARHTVGPL